MVVETVIDLFFTVFRGFFGAFEIINLPIQAIEALVSILAYGNWVVGIDIMALFAGSVVFWWGIHMSIGLAVWVWEHLPLT